jgi:hypothetical protein
VLEIHAPSAIVDQYIDYFKALGVAVALPRGSGDAS